MKIEPLFAPVREFFFPRGCALCGETLTGREEPLFGLCDPCRKKLDLFAEDTGTEYCDQCGRPLVSERGRCLPCREQGERLCEKIAVLYPYSGKYRKLLGEYKFGKNKALGFFLAEKLKEICARLFPAGSGMTDTGQKARGAPLLVPVPPRPGKLRKTGWDQVECLARFLDVYRCLRRLPSASQKKLNRKERLLNLQDRFVLTRPAPPAAVLFDDVITTGATLEACAGALKNAGTEKVYAVCLFYD